MNTWSDVLAGIAGELPGVRQIAAGTARGVVQRLCGFWLFWHMYGGVKGILSSGAGSESSTYRQLREFERVFGMTPDEFAPDLAEQVRSLSGRGPRG